MLTKWFTDAAQDLFSPLSWANQPYETNNDGSDEGESLPAKTYSTWSVAAVVTVDTLVPTDPRQD